MTYQLVPPHNPRRNLTENRIGTGKARIVPNIYGVSPKFPMHLWARLLLQMEMTLNMLRPSNPVPTVLAHVYPHGQHDYNLHPLAPLGCEVETRLKPTTRETWAPHSTSGFNIGTSFEHYWCFPVWLKDTRAVRASETVFFKHKCLTMPTITPEAALLKAA